MEAVEAATAVVLAAGAATARAGAGAVVAAEEVAAVAHLAKGEMAENSTSTTIYLDCVQPYIYICTTLCTALLWWGARLVGRFWHGGTGGRPSGGLAGQ